jgi:hypothetical protein
VIRGGTGEANVAAGLILLFVVVQMTLGLFFLLWLWVVLVKSAKNAHPDRREQLLRFAVISFTLAVALNFYFMLAHGSVEPSHKFAVFASFGLACLGTLLALLGRGRGRIVTVIASCGLAMSWLPFMLP